MRTLSGFDKTLDLYSGSTPRGGLPTILRAVRTYWSALADGMAAARAYHELTARGETHETAVRKVFDRHLGSR